MSKELLELRERHNNLAFDYAKKEQELAAKEAEITSLQAELSAEHAAYVRLLNEFVAYTQGEQ